MKAAIVFVAVFLELPLCVARADELCGRWDSINVLGGEYRINSNVWGGDYGEQCLTAYPHSTYFSVFHSTHDSSGVAAYPFIYKGCHWGGCTQNSGLPIQITDLVTAPFVWSIDTNSAGGVWNAAFESWFSINGGTAPDAAELMIWIDYNGGAGPAGTKYDTVTIGGHTWDFYFEDWTQPGEPGWYYIAYKITSPTNYVSLDLKDFIDDLLSRGFLEETWYLDNMEAGFEIWRDGEGLTSNSYVALVNEFISADLTDFADFAGHWYRTDCEVENDWCSGADYPPEDGLVNLYDLSEFTSYWLAQ